MQVDDMLFTDSKNPDHLGYPGLHPASELHGGVRVDRDVAVPMRDGTRIYVDVYRPELATDAPVLIAYGPYGKHGDFPPILAAGAEIEPPLPPATPFEAPVPGYWVNHGYAVIYADPRGLWGSEGDSSFFSGQEAQDGYDLVEWAGAQPWSNGKVGLSGVSYLAQSQYRIAATRPPHLAAINPSDGFSDVFREVVFHGGIPDTQFSMAQMTGLLGFGRNKTEDLHSELSAHPFLDGFWATKAIDLESIEVPAFFVCSVGNHGLHTRGTLEAYRRAGSSRKYLDVHGRKEWRYYYSLAGMERQRAFFDHFLKGLDTEVAAWPPVRVEYRDRTEIGPIREEAQWPPASMERATLYLDAATGQLRSTVPTEPVTTSYDPTRSPIRPYRHAGDEKAVFTVTFDADTEMAGAAVLRLWASSPGAADMDVFAVLDKIDQDGEVVRYPYCGYLEGPLAQGWLRASRRELDPERSDTDVPVQAHHRNLPLPPDGEPVALDIEIWAFTAHFRPGETLRLTIAGADIYRWGPEYLVNGHDQLNNSAPHILHTGGPYESSLSLPITQPSSTGHRTVG